jgi:hypothetical protein
MAEAADCAQEREQRNSFHLQREIRFGDDA